VVHTTFRFSTADSKFADRGSKRGLCVVANFMTWGFLPFEISEGNIAGTFTWWGYLLRGRRDKLIDFNLSRKASTIQFERDVGVSVSMHTLI
jgi:hypothetical protein